MYFELTGRDRRKEAEAYGERNPKHEEQDQTFEGKTRQHEKRTHGL